MTDQAIAMGPKTRIALVAHDNKKQALLEWAKFNRVLLPDYNGYRRRLLAAPEA